MKHWKTAAGILTAVSTVATFGVLYELRTLKSAYYEIESEKIRPGDELRVVLLTDLHERTYGAENSKLLQRIERESPDLILTGGDMITASEKPGYAESVTFFKNLLQIAPVYASFGNHEKRMSLKDDCQYEAFWKYVKVLKEAGVHWLLNESDQINPSVSLSGLDIDRKYYKKIRRQYYPIGQLQQDLASVPEECFNIVLAHNPRFFKTYAKSGGDLFLAGHYHGGAIRIAGRIGVISPQFRPFPRYSRGLYRRDDTAMIVSSGCGSHKVNLRLFNKPEVVVIDIHGHLI